MSADEEPKYLLGDHGREVERLRKQHSWIQYCLKDQIVFAPIDLQKPGLKVLDVGCADGMVSIPVIVLVELNIPLTIGW